MNQKQVRVLLWAIGVIGVILGISGYATLNVPLSWLLWVGLIALLTVVVWSFMLIGKNK